MSRVFISYSHDSDEHKERVAALVQRLRGDDVEIVVDSDQLPGGPTEGWPLWSERQVKEADFVLVACTRAYSERYEGNQPASEGLGAACEGSAIRQLLYDRSGRNEKFRVVLFESGDSQYIPIQLKRYHSFQPRLEHGYRELLAWLKGSGPSAAQPESLEMQWPAPADDYDSGLADRKDEFAAFEKIITRQVSQRVLLLPGASNQGKTVLIGALRAYAAHLGLPVVLFDFKGGPSLDELFEALLLDLGPDLLRDSSAAAGQARFYRLISDLKRLPGPLVLLFDTYQNALPDSQNWVETLMLPRLAELPGVVIVIGGQRVPEPVGQRWRSLAEICEVQAIRRVEDWVEYGNRRWQSRHLNKANVELLLRATDGNPGLLSALLENLVLSFQTEHGE